MKTRIEDGADPRYSSQRAASLQAIRLQALGIISETVPRASGATGFASPTGEMHGIGMPLAKGDIVSNLIVSCQTAGSGLTLAKLGLFSLRTSALLASSASVHVDWNASTGLKIVPMQVPYQVTDDDLYYAALLQVTGTTTAALLRSLGAIAGFGAMAPGFPSEFTRQTGQADLPATHTLVASASAVAFWIAAS